MAESLKKQTAKGLFWKFAEQFSNYGIYFFVGIAMARMLSPTDYGIAALPAVFMAISNVLISSGFGTALVRKPEIKEEDYSTAFYYSMGVGIVCYLILFFASPYVADFYNTPVLESLMRITTLSFVITPLSTVQYAKLQRSLNFKTPAKASVITNIVSSAVGIGLAYTGYGVWALVISNLLGTILNTAIITSVVRWYPKTGWSKDSFRYLWGFGNKLLGSGLLDQIYENIAPIIIGKFFSPAKLGIYNTASSYALLPARDITNTVQAVSFPVLSKIQNDDEKLMNIYRRMIRVSCFIIFPIILLLAALARPIIIVLITEKWEASIILLQILCFSCMFYPVHALNLNVLQVKGRSDYFLKLEIIKKCYGIVILTCSLPFGLVVYCCSDILESMISLVVNTYYTGKLLNYGFIKQMKDIIPFYIMAFTMFLIVLGVTYFIDNNCIKIAVGLPLGILLYWGMSVLFKLKELAEVKSLILKKK